MKISESPKEQKVFGKLHQSGLNRKQRRMAQKFRWMESRSHRIELARRKEFYRRNPDKRPLKPVEVDVEVISGNVEDLPEVEEVSNDETV